MTSKYNEYDNTVAGNYVIFQVYQLTDPVFSVYTDLLYVKNLATGVVRLLTP